MKIKILLVDDHTVVRSGLTKFLRVNTDFQLVGEASDGSEAIQLASPHKPDVILMDLMMPGMDGVTGTRTIHEKMPAVKIIALGQLSLRWLYSTGLHSSDTIRRWANDYLAQLHNIVQSVRDNQF